MTAEKISLKLLRKLNGNLEESGSWENTNISRLNISRRSKVTEKCKKCQVCYKSQVQKKEWKQSLVKETSVIGKKAGQWRKPCIGNIYVCKKSQVLVKCFAGGQVRRRQRRQRHRYLSRKTSVAVVMPNVLVQLKGLTTCSSLITIIDND